MNKPLPLPLIALIIALVALISPAFAIDDMQDQETIAELLATPASPPGEQQKEVSQRPWAVLPEFGYGPETGAKGGLKFQNRDIFGLGADLDVHGSYAMNQQESFTMVIATPHLLEDQAVGFFRLHYDHDPQLNFFSIGNNNVTHEPPALTTPAKTKHRRRRLPTPKGPSSSVGARGSAWRSTSASVSNTCMLAAATAMTVYRSLPTPTRT